jgi:hypothetical protein
MSQSMIVVSALPVARLVPSGENAALQIRS